MKRTVLLHSLVFICLAVECAAFGQDAKTKGKQVCPFSIVGLWRMEGTTEMTRMFFDFSSEGHVTLLGHSANALPQDFEMLGSVNYKLDKRTAPKHIEFITTRGNDAFLPGITPLDIIEYSDSSFTTRDPASGQQTRWVREQMRRYFLTLAARSGPDSGPALAMWTVMDGRNTKVDALGIQMIKDEGKTAPVFGPVPAEIYSQIREESEKEKKNNKDETAILRFELTQAEFEKTQKTYQIWDKYVRDRALPNRDAYLNTMEFLTKVVEGLNQCGEKTRLYKPTLSEQGEIASRYETPRRMLEYIRMLRKKNEELHISDVEFPWQWRPMIQAPGQ